MGIISLPGLWGNRILKKSNPIRNRSKRYRNGPNRVESRGGSEDPMSTKSDTEKIDSNRTNINISRGESKRAEIISDAKDPKSTKIGYKRVRFNRITLNNDRIEP